MSRLFNAKAILILGFVLAGCTAGLPYHQAKPDFAKLAPGKSRVFVYRTLNMVELVHPRVIWIDAKPFGDALSGTVTFRDVNPGQYIFSEAGRRAKIRVQLRPNEAMYLRLTLHSQPTGELDSKITVVPRQTAEQDMHVLNVIEAKVRDLVK